MGISVKFYYGIAIRLDNILTESEYDAWRNDDMDDSHILHRLNQAGFYTTSSEDMGTVLLVGLDVGDPYYKSYYSRNVLKEHWINQLIESGIEEINDKFKNMVNVVNEIAGREILTQVKPYFYSLSNN